MPKDARTPEEAAAAVAAAAAKVSMDGDASDAAAWAAAAELSPADDGDDAGVNRGEGAAGPDAAAAAAAADDEEEKVPWRYAPHMLGMSATPIPRTVVMCKYGEMALSCIDEKPAGTVHVHQSHSSARPLVQSYSSIPSIVQSHSFIYSPLDLKRRVN